LSSSSNLHLLHTDYCESLYTCVTLQSPKYTRHAPALALSDSVRLNTLKALGYHIEGAEGP
jgi:hypothetical protein